MKKNIKSTMTVALLTGLVSSTAVAGDTLRFNAGFINTLEAQKSVSSFYNSANSETEWIVQFQKPITSANKNNLKAMKAEIFGYLPDDALVVRADQKIMKAFQQKYAGVTAIIPYASSYKISSDIGTLNLFNQETHQAVMVKIFKKQELLVLAQQMKDLSAGVTIQDLGDKVIVAVLPKHLIPAVAALTGVEHIQAQVEIETMNFAMDGDVRALTTNVAGDYSDINGYETGTKVMKMDAAWAAGFTGKNQIASMADTGLDSGKENAIHGDFQSVVKKGFFFGLFSKDWSDPMGHGTHVAGSIVGRGTASSGKLRGAAFDAQFIAEGMWSPMMNGLSVPAKLQDLFVKAYAEGARVHSNSWGAARSFGNYDTMASSVDEFMFNNPEMLVLFAAGNSGVDLNKDGRIDENSIGTPGTAKNVLTVGASENKVSNGGIQVPVSKFRAAHESWSAEPIYSSYISDNENGLAMFSSRGPTADGRTKPEIVAPGTNVLSVRSQIAGASELWGAYNQDYVWSGGTSMATPLVAGAASVVRQIVQEKWGLAAPSGALLKAVLLHSADDLYPGQFGEVGKAKGQELLTRRPNSDQGYGRADIANVVALDKNVTTLVDNKLGVGQAAEVVYEFTSAQSFSIIANLVWTDAPGSANAAKALVNDLDLSLVSADGIIAPNDHVNNNEIIEQSALPAGAYKLVVKGYNVPQAAASGQPYALVFTLK